MDLKRNNLTKDLILYSIYFEKIRFWVKWTSLTCYVGKGYSPYKSSSCLPCCYLGQRNTQQKVPSTLFRIHELPYACNCLISLINDREESLQSIQMISQTIFCCQTFLPFIITLNVVQHPWNKRVMLNYIITAIVLVEHLPYKSL